MQKLCTVCGERERAKSQTQCLECKRKINRESKVKSQVQSNMELSELKETIEKLAAKIVELEKTIYEFPTVDDIDFEKEVKKVLDEINRGGY